jgi:hypothetical protein
MCVCAFCGRVFLPNCVYERNGNLPMLCFLFVDLEALHLLRLFCAEIHCVRSYTVSMLIFKGYKTLISNGRS